ncbi:MAG: hypothetical protein KGS10_04555 [Chloroflexi bacterium]|nr:hypothetical protein [Chloroflexota bacterium]
MISGYYLADDSAYYVDGAGVVRLVAPLAMGVEGIRVEALPPDAVYLADYLLDEHAIEEAERWERGSAM